MVPAILFMCYYGNSLLLTPIHFKEFLERSCQTKIKLNSVKNEVNGCKMKTLHQTSTLSGSPLVAHFLQHFSLKFLQVVFFFSLKFLILHSGNFSMKQEMWLFLFTSSVCLTRLCFGVRIFHLFNSKCGLSIE